MAAITSSAIAAITGIVSLVIVVRDKYLDQMSAEEKFETLRKAMNKAAETHPRVAKFDGWYCFCDKRDFDRVEVKGGVFSLYQKKIATNRRCVYFRPRDGFFSNDWLYMTTESPNGREIKKGPDPISTDECWKIFQDGYKDSDGTLAMRRRVMEDTIHIT